MCSNKQPKITIESNSPQISNDLWDYTTLAFKTGHLSNKKLTFSQWTQAYLAMNFLSSSLLLLLFF